VIRTVVHFVDSSTFGGSEQALLHLLAGLDRQDWRPILFHHDEPGLASLMKAARALNIETKVVPKLAGARLVLALPRFIHELRTVNPQIFHAHLNWLLSCRYGLLAAYLARIPVIVATVHNFMEPPWARTIELAQRVFGKCLHRYIVVSNAVGRQLCESFHVPCQKVEVIHNSIPAAAFDRPPDTTLKTMLNRGTDRPIVLCVARLDAQKGHTYLLPAVRNVPNAIFVLVGDGSERASLEAQAANIGVRDRVIFLGHRDDVAELLATCDLLVLPSLYEGLPLSVLEAMAAGKPVVATSVGGTPEAVLDGETGFLVPSRDPTALVRAIQRLLTDACLRRKMGMAGRRRVQRNFSPTQMVAGVTQTYEKLLDRREKSSAHY
jgi:glycosyltransferase involved in cell wall biosynthesis